MDLWNHYDNRGPKTNNHVEGFNSKIKVYFPLIQTFGNLF